MKKGDLCIEILAWMTIAAIIGFCFWIDYELSLPVS